MEHAIEICSLSNFEKQKAALLDALNDWADDQIAMHTDPELTGVPRGTGGSILGLGNPIASKRVLEASAITEDLIGMKIPPAIIAKGGYATASECVESIMSGLEKVVTGKIKIKQPKSKAWQKVTA